MNHQYFANLSNSAAGVRLSIRQEPHWLHQLKQCELTIRAREADLDEQQQVQKRCDRQLKRYEFLARWLRLGWARDEAAYLRRCRDRTLPLIRDAEMELAIAREERDRILSEHPEITTLDYRSAQESYTEEALLSHLGRFCAARIWAAQRGLPESVGEAIANLSETQRQQVMLVVQKELSGVDGTAALVELSTFLSALDAGDRAHVLSEALKIISPALPENQQHGTTR